MSEPCVAYVFMVQRPADKEPWPVAFQTRAAAEGYPYRVTSVAAVCLTKYDEPMNTEEK